MTRNRSLHLYAYDVVKQCPGSAPRSPAAPSEVAGFERVFSQRWTPMVRLATLTTGSVALAEEIVQEAFAQLYRRWDNVDEPCAWLRKAVVNGCRDWTRRQIVERRHARAPLQVLEPNEGLAIRDALAVVTSRQRAAIVLRYYEDLPEAEIAELLHCRPGTVKSLLARGLRTLRKELQP